MKFSSQFLFTLVRRKVRVESLFSCMENNVIIENFISQASFYPPPSLPMTNKAKAMITKAIHTITSLIHHTSHYGFPVSGGGRAGFSKSFFFLLITSYLLYCTVHQKQSKCAC